VSNQPAAPARKLVKQYALDDLAGKLESGLKGGRDWERGRVLFGQTTCFSCHRYGNEGGAQGPDLTGVAGRFSPRDLLESILEPSKTISDQYEAVIIETTDGKLVSGRIVNLNGDTMMVMTNMLDPNDMASIDRKRVESVTSSKVSMMPKGLLDTLETDEILDLMAYMLAKGDKGHSMFKK
jgi:putative heme-binding domain-containing protein